MTSTANLTSSVPNWKNSPLTHTPTPEQLNQIQTHLDLVLLAIESLITIDTDKVQQAALDLEISTGSIEGVTLWSNRGIEETKNVSDPLTIDQMRSLILIICHLAQQHQELIRRAVTFLEQMTAQHKDPVKTTLLGNYFQRFNDFYQSGNFEDQPLPTAQHTKLASKLLIDLLFYSANSGHHRFWLALLNYTR
ncbi:MAG: DUF3038 domain-containing protein [Cyanobacteria bacterium P01_G01_bin.49]